MGTKQSQQNSCGKSEANLEIFYVLEVVPVDISVFCDIHLKIKSWSARQNHLGKSSNKIADKNKRMVRTSYESVDGVAKVILRNTEKNLEGSPNDRGIFLLPLFQCSVTRKQLVRGQETSSAPCLIRRGRIRFSLILLRFREDHSQPKTEEEETNLSVSLPSECPFWSWSQS